MKREMKWMIRITAALVLFAGFFLQPWAFADEMIQIKGSDTLVNLVQRLSEVYMGENPGSFIAITGGGSGTGIAAMINGKCDIANASRAMKTPEIARTFENGIDVKRVVIAMDGLSVIVNAGNPIEGLTLDQIGKIFRGEVTNWKDVGGNDMDVTLYGRQSNSGTFVFFREAVLKGDYSQKMNRMNGNAQIVEAVKHDASGVGYVGVGYVRDAKGLKVLKVATAKGAAYASPLNAEDVKKGLYPVTRPLNQYLRGVPKGAVKDFITFELSESGQKVVEEEGFFPIPTKWVEANKEQLGF